MNERVRSLAGVAHVEVVHGAEAAPEAEPMLLLEVPHGADREVDYDLLRQQLVGTFPSDLKHFFFVNTDVGAWALARAIAHPVDHRVLDHPGAEAGVADAGQAESEEG